MFIQNIWYIAAWSKEITQQPLARRICNEPVVIFRDQSGMVAALEDRCCHRAAPLHFGEVVEDGLQCGYHGLVFANDGRCVRIPGQPHIPATAKIKSYPVVEKDEFIWIWIGDPNEADITAIIDYPYHNDHEHWPHKNGMMHIKGHYMLMVDNLMDLTHLGYLHKKTIGGDPNTHVEAKMEIERKPEGLKYTRWMLDCNPPPSYAAAVGFKGKIDRWQEFEFLAPGSIIQWSGATDAGTGAYEGHREGGLSWRLFHGLTPETEESCFYFFSTAAGYRQDDPATAEQLYQVSVNTFVEDKAIVEEQQSRLNEFGESDLVAIQADTSRVYIRRIYQQLLDESNGVAAVAS